MKTMTFFATTLLISAAVTTGCSNDNDGNDSQSNSDTPNVATEQPDGQNPIPDQSSVQNPNIDSTAVDALVTEFMADSKLPGLSLALLSFDTETPTIWSQGYGVTDINSGNAVDENTAFWLASTTKPVVGVLLQIAQEQGILDVDTDIRADVTAVGGFTIDDPLAREITVRDLAYHTSGIVDADSYACAYYVSNDDGSVDSLSELIDYGVPCDVQGRTSLSDYLASYLDADGINYSASDNFGPDEDEYSNIGVGLAGLYLEQKTGQSLQDYGASQLFEPLGMENTGWTRESLANTDIATPHEASGELVALPEYDLATYPDGGLRSTAGDMANFLA